MLNPNIEVVYLDVHKYSSHACFSMVSHMHKNDSTEDSLKKVKWTVARKMIKGWIPHCKK